mmetsp:Transcript_47067/g.132754  ORF Transcript_47067/g.132754 Transcript_47067/m.132754 type:complete len:288 (-) Transcript_47067:43-906(-)
MPSRAVRLLGAAACSQTPYWPALRGQRCSARPPWQRGRHSFATFIVDGGHDSQFVAGKLRSLSRGHREAIDVLAVGQSGVFTALRAIAELKSPAPAPASPTFKLTPLDPGDVRPHAREGYTIAGHNNYRLALLAVGSWEAKSKWQADSKLLVGNRTVVMPLAKAVAARVKLLPEGRSVLVETAILGNEQPRNLRVARLANAVARAYEWQVRPVDASRPTRPFRCSARLVGGEPPSGEAREDEGDSCFLQVEVFPDGPTGGSLLGAQPGSAGDGPTGGAPPAGAAAGP